MVTKKSALFRPSALQLRLVNKLWRQEPVGEVIGWFSRFLYNAGRISYVVIRDLWRGDMNFRAMGLVYTTLLSLVPTLAISVSVLKAFGADIKAREALSQFFEPLGERGDVVIDTIFSFVERVDFAVLGSIGVAFLIYTVISLLEKMESALNTIWRVRKSRTLIRRFSDFLSVILLGPFLIFLALGISTTALSSVTALSIADVRVFGPFIRTAQTILPYLFIIGAFTVVYVFIPNTKVRVSSALIGATVAGILWHTIGWMFAYFVATSASYAEVYSAFASLIVFLIWIYAGWLILLIGAAIAYYHQHPAKVLPEESLELLSHAEREELAMNIAYLVALRFQKGQAPLTEEILARRLNASFDMIERLTQELVDGQILTRTSNEPPHIMPARGLDQISACDVFDIIRRLRKADLPGHELKSEEVVKELIENLNAAREETLSGVTLATLVEKAP